MNRKRIYQVRIFSESTFERLEESVNQWLSIRSDIPEFEFVSAELSLSPLSAIKVVMVSYREVIKNKGV